MPLMACVRLCYSQDAGGHGVYAMLLLAGVFVSSWLGGLLLQVGEWIIKKLPLVKHIYSAAKQVSAAVNPANEATQSFRECVLIRHPRNGEYAFGFITGQTLLQVAEKIDVENFFFVIFCFLWDFIVMYCSSHSHSDCTLLQVLMRMQILSNIIRHHH